MALRDGKEVKSVDVELELDRCAAKKRVYAQVVRGYLLRFCFIDNVVVLYTIVRKRGCGIMCIMKGNCSPLSLSYFGKKRPKEQ